MSATGLANNPTCSKLEKHFIMTFFQLLQNALVANERSSKLRKHFMMTFFQLW